MTTIVLTGPESCGKSTLAHELAATLSAGLVEELARNFLNTCGKVGRYQPSDLLRIASFQNAVEQSVLLTQNVTVCDTDLQVLAIWWAERFGPIPSSLVKRYGTSSARFYLLCRPDLPWEADPQREHPEDRERLYELYKSDLESRNLEFAEVEGSGSNRTTNALAHARNFLSAMDL